jgi:stearoyl-CoA desaturase (delta-9 desaturase)
MKSLGNSKPYVLVIIIVPFTGTASAIGLLWQRSMQLSDLVLLAAMYTATDFGFTIGFHRMLTHRSFRAHSAVKFINTERPHCLY